MKRQVPNQASGMKRRLPKQCARCNYSLSGLPTTKCPECGFSNSNPFFAASDPLLDRIDFFIHAAFVVSLIASIALLAVFAWRFYTGHVIAIPAACLLGVPLLSWRLWEAGDRGMANDRSVARAVYGVAGAILTIVSQVAAGFMMF